MAKLSAHGNELIRLEKESGPSEYSERIRTSLAVMADGKILRKVDSWYRRSWSPEKLEHQCSGWKRYNKLGPSVTATDYANHLRATGWTLVEKKAEEVA